MLTGMRLQGIGYGSAEQALENELPRLFQVEGQ